MADETTQIVGSDISMVFVIISRNLAHNTIDSVPTLILSHGSQGPRKVEVMQVSLENICFRAIVLFQAGESSLFLINMREQYYIQIQLKAIEILHKLAENRMDILALEAAWW